MEQKNLLCSTEYVYFSVLFELLWAVCNLDSYWISAGVLHWLGLRSRHYFLLSMDNVIEFLFTHETEFGMFTMSVIRNEPGAIPSTWLPSTLRHPRHMLMLSYCSIFQVVCFYITRQISVCIVSPPHAVRYVMLMYSPVEISAGRIFEFSHS